MFHERGRDRRTAGSLIAALGSDQISSGRITQGQAYVIALVLTSATLALRLSLEPELGGRPTLVLFVLPILLSAYIGGFAVGLLATALTWLAAAWFLFPPLHSFRIASPVDRWQLFFVAVLGVVISIVNEALHRARRRADLAMWEQRAANEKFHQLADNITDAFWIRSADMRVVHYVSPAFSRIWGRPVETLYSNPAQWTDFIVPEDRPSVVEAFKAFMEEQRALEIEYRIMRPDGEVRWVLVRGFQVRDALGTVIRRTGIVTDISERKRAAAALLESEERYRALVEWSPEAIAVSRDGVILFVNQATVSMMGASSEADLVGQSVLRGVHDESVDLVRKRVETIAASGGVLPPAEERVIRFDGREIVIESRSTSIMFGGEPAVFSTMRDVTERKKLEHQFLRAQRMEGIGTLAGGIAHDINNVLAPILLSIETLKEIVTSPEDLPLLNVLHESAQRGAALVRQVLSFARGVEGERVSVNPLPLMRDLLKVMQDTFPRSIDVRFVPAPDLWTVTGDRTQLYQVFLNLAVNARDAMPKGGQLVIRMDNVTLTGREDGLPPDAVPGDYVRVKVADTGSGIPPEIRDMIFEPFFTTKEMGKGTGLGLSTTFAIVRSHGGFIDVESAMKVGTTFSVFLPANFTESAAESVADATALPRGQGELVLVVDDEEAIRAIVRRTLERFGYRVLLAMNGTEAVQLYTERQSEIALVLTDMAMPVMDGAATITALIAINPRVLIIASSGFSSDGGLAEPVSGAIQQFVPKPYTAEVLLRTVHDVLHDAHSPTGRGASR